MREDISPSRINVCSCCDRIGKIGDENHIITFFQYLPGYRKHMFRIFRTIVPVGVFITFLLHAPVAVQAAEDIIRDGGILDELPGLENPGGSGADGEEDDYVPAFDLGVKAYRNGDYQKAIDQWQDLADGELAEAQYNLGVIHEYGRGVPRDPEKAVFWYALAADQKLPEAVNNLGRMYTLGIGVDKDEAEGFQYYREAANLGLADAAYNVGIGYLTGLGTEKNDRQAVVWFNKAAEKNYLPAQYNLAALYASGRGAQKNRKRAAFWYKKAADQGDGFARYNYALLLLSGAEKNNHAIAAGYMAKAAKQGVVPAQNQLGVMYFRGQGVEKDPETALMWFEIAAQLGSEKAQKNKTMIARMMPQKSTRRAIKRARSFRVTSN